MNPAHFVRSRRQFLQEASCGFGYLALAGLADEAAPAAAGPTAASPAHFPARAKRVIFLCMAGGPSHLETFDFKPKLLELQGQPMPESFTKGQPIALTFYYQRATTFDETAGTLDTWNVFVTANGTPMATVTRRAASSPPACSRRRSGCASPRRPRRGR